MYHVFSLSYVCLFMISIGCSESFDLDYLQSKSSPFIILMNFICVSVNYAGTGRLT